MSVIRTKTLRPGDVVEIIFLDHAEHDFAADNGDLEFALYGRVVLANARTLTVETWCYADPLTPFDANVVRYTIIRGAIKKLTVLRPAAKGSRRVNGNRKINGGGYSLLRRRRRTMAARSRN